MIVFKLFKPIMKLSSQQGQVIQWFKFYKWRWFYMWRDRCPSDKEGLNSVGDLVVFAVRAKDRKPVTILFWCEKEYL